MRSRRVRPAPDGLAWLPRAKGPEALGLCGVDAHSICKRRLDYRTFLPIVSRPSSLSGGPRASDGAAGDATAWFRTCFVGSICFGAGRTLFFWQSIGQPQHWRWSILSSRKQGGSTTQQGPTVVVVTHRQLAKYPEEMKARKLADASIRESLSAQAAALERLNRGTPKGIPPRRDK